MFSPFNWLKINSFNHVLKMNGEEKYQNTINQAENLVQKKKMVLFRLIKISLPLLRWTQNPRSKTKHTETIMVILFPRITQLYDRRLKKIKTCCWSFYTNIKLRCAGWQWLLSKYIITQFNRLCGNYQQSLTEWQTDPFPSRLQITCVFKKFHNIPCIFVCLYN